MLGISVMVRVGLGFRSGNVTCGPYCQHVPIPAYYGLFGCFFFTAQIDKELNFEILILQYHVYVAAGRWM